MQGNGFYIILLFLVCIVQLPFKDGFYRIVAPFSKIISPGTGFIQAIIADPFCQV